MDAKCKKESNELKKKKKKESRQLNKEQKHLKEIATPDYWSEASLNGFERLDFDLHLDVD